MVFALQYREDDFERKEKREDGMSQAIAKGMAILVGVLLFPALVLAQGDQAKGKGLFTKYCVGCHGATGKGDGVAAAALNPKPADLTNKAYMAGLKDQYLSDLIQKGGAAVGKSPLMTPFGSTLKDGDIRDVIAYVRSLAK
jgi:mono/diheme cytochrome c family protein